MNTHEKTEVRQAEPGFNFTILHISTLLAALALLAAFAAVALRTQEVREARTPPAAAGEQNPAPDIQ